MNWVDQLSSFKALSNETHWSHSSIVCTCVRNYARSKSTYKMINNIFRLCVCCVIDWIFCVSMCIQSTCKLIQTLRADVYEFKKPKSLGAVRFHLYLVCNQKFIIWLDFNFNCRWNCVSFFPLSKLWCFCHLYWE